MVDDDLIFKFRLRLFSLAGELGNVREACRLMGVHPSTFYRWREQGIAPRVMKLPSGAVRIRRTALEEWLRGLEDTPKEHAA